MLRHKYFAIFVPGRFVFMSFNNIIRLCTYKYRVVAVCWFLLSLVVYVYEHSIFDVTMCLLLRI